MVHLTHSALHWRLRCINDTSSDDENTPPNVRSSKQEDTGGTISDIGTATPRSLTPAQSKPRPKTAVSTPPNHDTSTVHAASSPATRRCPSPTTSSPVLLETPPQSPPRPRISKTLHPRRDGRRARRESAAPESRRCDPRREVDVGAGVLLLTKFRAQHVEVALLQQLLKIQGVLVVKTAASLQAVLHSKRSTRPAFLRFKPYATSVLCLSIHHSQH
ncbi:hypothetical protein PI124_g8157 [Phytophthora idaei]|nr:hypothetical protein PI124_g8157 [Phytophthora idaei]